MKHTKQFIKNKHDDRIKALIKVNFSDNSSCEFFSFSNQLNLNSKFS